LTKQSIEKSPGITKLNWLAPAAIQSSISLLLISRRTGGGVDLFWKTLVFLSFHTIQLTSMVREAIALRFRTPLLDVLPHHFLMDRFAVHSCMMILWSPSHSFAIPHSFCVVTMQEEVSCRLLGLIAKRAKATICQTPLLKMVCRP
jgi:hypothetical protein